MNERVMTHKIKPDLRLQLFCYLVFISVEKLRSIYLIFFTIILNCFRNVVIISLAINGVREIRKNMLLSYEFEHLIEKKFQ